MALSLKSLFLRNRVGAWICCSVWGWSAVFGAQAQVGFETTQLWSSSVPGFTEVPGDTSVLGAALAVGDFNGDHYPDLAIGEIVGPSTDPRRSGFVHVLSGGSQGLALPTLVLSQQVPGSPDPPEASDDRFGEFLAVGDFNGDGVDELAVGLPYEDVGGLSDAGALQVFWGAFGQGLLPSPSQFFTQDTPGFPGVSEAEDEFGRAVAAGDFNADGFDDLAVGVWGENNLAGQVQILFGSVVGLSTAGIQTIDQNSGGPFSPAMLDIAEADDRFGAHLTSGDFNGDLYADLAIGVPGEDLWVGAVAVMWGTSSGLTILGNQLWRPNSPGLVAPTERGWFGWGLAAGDFDNNGRDDLAIGAPFASVTNASGTFVREVGTVRVLRGSVSGLTATGTQLFTQDSPGFPDVAEAGDRFGNSLAGGDFNNDGYADLVIGAPWEMMGTVGEAGSAFLLFGSPSSLNIVGARQWSLANVSLGGNTLFGDLFGYAIAAGDFDADGKDDLAMGAPGSTFGDPRGKVAVVYEPAPLTSPPPPLGLP